MKTSTSKDGQNRAVSPVIGVILMVAITVILAAVIGAFVLEIGDQQETAPNTSFSSDEEVKYYWLGQNRKDCDSNECANLSTVYISHAGGDTIDVSQSEIVINGNSTVWGIDVLNENDLAQVGPRPDIRPTLGTNEKAEFKSGEEWNPYLYCGEECKSSNPTSGHEDREWGNGIWTNQYQDYDNDGTIERAILQEIGTWNGVGNPDPLRQGDDVNVVWTAESGGKTQTLFKYTVQQSGDA